MRGSGNERDRRGDREIHSESYGGMLYRGGSMNNIKTCLQEIERKDCDARFI